MSLAHWTSNRESLLSTQQDWISDDGARYYVVRVGVEYAPVIEIDGAVSLLYIGASSYPTREAAERVIQHVLRQERRNRLKN